MVTKTLNPGESGDVCFVVANNVGSSGLILWEWDSVTVSVSSDSVLECRLTTRQKKNEDIAYPVSQQNVYTFSH